MKRDFGVTGSGNSVRGYKPRTNRDASPGELRPGLQTPDDQGHSVWGFTLLELTVVIGIIAILASILFPVFARARETARRSSCASNLSQLGIALNMYAQAYNGHFPPKDNDMGPVYQFAHSQDIFWCPSDPDRTEWKMKPVQRPYMSDARFVVKALTSYVYKGGLMNDDRADTPIASEARTWHHDLVNILYLGGHVRARPVEGYKPVVEPPARPPGTPDYPSRPMLPPPIPPPPG